MFLGFLYFKVGKYVAFEFRFPRIVRLWFSIEIPRVKFQVVSWLAYMFDNCILFHRLWLVLATSLLFCIFTKFVLNCIPWISLYLSFTFCETKINSFPWRASFCSSKCCSRQFFPSLLTIITWFIKFILRLIAVNYGLSWT